MSQSNSAKTETSRTNPEGLSDEELVEAYADVAEEAGNTIQEYDAIVQEMAERFEANVLNGDDQQ